MDLAILIYLLISFIENYFINSLPTSDIFCLTLTIFLTEFFEKVNFEKKNQQMTKKAIKITQHAVCQVD